MIPENITLWVQTKATFKAGSKCTPRLFWCKIVHGADGPHTTSNAKESGKK